MYLTLVYTLTHGINFCPCSKCLEFIPNVRISCSSSKSQVLAQPHLDQKTNLSKNSHHHKHLIPPTTGLRPTHGFRIQTNIVLLPSGYPGLA